MEMKEEEFFEIFKDTQRTVLGAIDDGANQMKATTDHMAFWVDSATSIACSAIFGNMENFITDDVLEDFVDDDGVPYGRERIRDSMIANFQNKLNEKIARAIIFPEGSQKEL